jgi:glyoxylase-like metal-dependent hydrolase (beta-lactamase superfamily II)
VHEAGFHYDVGEFKCTIFSDGTIVNLESDNGEVFGLNCICIDSGDHKILVDTGCGDGFQPTAGRLVRNLEAAGIRCADIDRIVITHGHIDHVGGSFDSRGKAIFPYARYITWEKEWAYWETEPETNEVQNMLFETARKYFLPIADRFDLAKDNDEILPGIRMIPAPGHTPGNAMVDISSGKDRLLCIGDIIHSPLEFTDPEHLTIFDVKPEQALNTRARILSDIARTGTPVFACHFPFPGLGYITFKEGLFGWQPIY